MNHSSVLLGQSPCSGGMSGIRGDVRDQGGCQGSASLPEACSHTSGAEMSQVLGLGTSWDHSGLCLYPVCPICAFPVAKTMQIGQSCPCLGNPNILPPRPLHRPHLTDPQGLRRDSRRCLSPPKKKTPRGRLTGLFMGTGTPPAPSEPPTGGCSDIGGVGGRDVVGTASAGARRRLGEAALCPRSLIIKCRRPQPLGAPPALTEAVLGAPLPVPSAESLSGGAGCPAPL